MLRQMPQELAPRMGVGELRKEEFLERQRGSCKQQPPEGSSYFWGRQTLTIVWHPAAQYCSPSRHASHPRASLTPHLISSRV